MKKEEIELKKERIKNVRLERQIEYLLMQLSEISQGIGSKLAWYTGQEKSVFLQHKAGLTIQKLHEMRK